jgi:hypothetical protein
MRNDMAAMTCPEDRESGDAITAQFVVREEVVQILCASS